MVINPLRNALVHQVTVAKLKFRIEQAHLIQCTRNVEVDGKDFCSKAHCCVSLSRLLLYGKVRSVLGMCRAYLEMLALMTAGVK